MIQLNDETFHAHLKSTDKPVLVQFSAVHCGPCRMQKPLLERFGDEHPEIEVAYVDVDESPRAALEHDVTGLPTLALFVAGERRAYARGLQSPPKLASLIDSLRDS
jgi:thioredoxin 1